MILRHELAEPIEQMKELQPLSAAGQLPRPPIGLGERRSRKAPEINCPMVLLCSELGFYFTYTELVTNQAHMQLIN